MLGDAKLGMSCSEFEALLAEALDGTLSPTQAASFNAHRASCSRCAPLFNEAQIGWRWLATLKEEVDPPEHLVARILGATSGLPRAAGAPAPSWWERLRATSLLAPVFREALQARFAMSLAMAVFSISLLLNLTGVRLTDLRRLDLRPSTLVRGYYETEGRLVKYYENMRFIYEFESRVHDLKRATTPVVKPPADPAKAPRDDRTGPVILPPVSGETEAAAHNWDRHSLPQLRPTAVSRPLGERHELRAT